MTQADVSARHSFVGPTFREAAGVSRTVATSYVTINHDRTRELVSSIRFVCDRNYTHMREEVPVDVLYCCTGSVSHVLRLFLFVAIAKKS